MSVFSFTAPVVTPQEEQEERNALSTQERELIQSDMYGDNSSDNKTTCCENDDGKEPDRALDIMKETIDSCISDSEKAAYLEALKHAPHLIQMKQFLQCEQNDPWSAAHRLVRYWSLRKELFGENAWKPMTLQGAMAEDYEYLAKGVLYTLSPDDHGRPVLFYDRIRATKKVIPRQTLARCWFYVASVAAAEINHQEGDSSSRGIVYLVNCRVSVSSKLLDRLKNLASLTFLQSFDLYQHFDRALMKLTTKIIHFVPARLMSVHFCTGPGKSV
jgi:hypothetical protein